MYPDSKRSLLWAFFYLYKSYYITIVANNIFNMFVNMLKPLLRYRFVQFIENEEYDQSSIVYALIISLGSIFLDSYLHCISGKNSKNFQNMGKITVGSLKAMIFNKNFKMAASGQKHYTTAMVNGLISRDTSRIWNFANQMSGMITVPFSILYSGFFLVQYMGISAIPGGCLFMLKMIISRW